MSSDFALRDLNSLAHDLQQFLAVIEKPKSGSIYFKVEGAGKQSHVVIKEGGFFTWLASKIWPAQYALNRVSSILIEQLSSEPFPNPNISDLFGGLLTTASKKGKLGNQSSNEQVERLIQTVRKKQSVVRRILGVESNTISLENISEVKNKTRSLLRKLEKVQARSGVVRGTLKYATYIGIVASIQKLLEELPETGPSEKAWDEKFRTFTLLLVKAESFLKSI